MHVGPNDYQPLQVFWILSSVHALQIRDSIDHCDGIVYILVRSLFFLKFLIFFIFLYGGLFSFLFSPNPFPFSLLLFKSVQFLKYMGINIGVGGAPF